jgi:hypothetical protein
MLWEYTKTISYMWTLDVQSTFDSLRNFILEDPCLRRFDPAKLTVLRTDFPSKGFGYVVCQPDDDNVSLEHGQWVLLPYYYQWWGITPCCDRWSMHPRERDIFTLISGRGFLQQLCHEQVPPYVVGTPFHMGY